MNGDFDELDLSLESDPNSQDEELTVRAFLHFMEIFCFFEVDGDR